MYLSRIPNNLNIKYLHYINIVLSNESISCHLFPVLVPPTTSQSLPSSSSIAMTTGMPTTEPLPPTVANATPESNPTSLSWLRTKRLNSNECYRYAYGTFMGNITIIGRW